MSQHRAVHARAHLIRTGRAIPTSRLHRRRTKRQRSIAVSTALAAAAVTGAAFWLTRADADTLEPAIRTPATDESIEAAPNWREPEPVTAAPGPGSVPLRGGLAPIANDSGLVPAAPPAAISAYQRATTVINAATDRCHLDWTVLAAIGRVESNHGTKGDSRLTDEGAARPGIFGKPLDGRGGRGRLRDTDAGQLDHDPTWDAPVGPLGILPSTWAQVGVDADGDDKRDPQDIDDAALGAAVLLCAHNRNLSNETALRDALHAYNPTPGYARIVVRLAQRFATEGDLAPTIAEPAVVEPIPDRTIATVADTVARTDKRKPSQFAPEPRFEPVAGPRPDDKADPEPTIPPEPTTEDPCANGDPTPDQPCPPTNPPAPESSCEPDDSAAESPSRCPTEPPTPTDTCTQASDPAPDQSCAPSDPPAPRGADPEA